MSKYCFTDIHGCLDFYDAIMDWIKKYDPNSTIVFCGDACDRGENGYEIMSKLLTNPKITYLRGNHEQLFINAVDGIIGFCAQSDEYYNLLHNVKTQDQAIELLTKIKNTDVALHCVNGGYTTLIEWMLLGANEEIIDQIRNLPYTYSYKNIDFCHAGCSYNAFINVREAELTKTSIPQYDANSLIWDRNSIALGWQNERIAIFGHTPIQHLPSALRKSKSLTARPCWWRDHMSEKRYNGLKIDLDTAVADSNNMFLLNCDTMTTIHFCKIENQIIALPSITIPVN